MNVPVTPVFGVLVSMEITDMTVIVPPTIMVTAVKSVYHKSPHKLKNH